MISRGSGGCWPWFATCQIGATSRWHVRSKSHIASISRITTGFLFFLCHQPFFLLNFGWGCFFWILRMVEVGFSWLYAVYCLCVCLLVLFWEDRKSDDDDASFYECESLAGDQWCTNSSHATISPPRSAVVPYRPCWRLQRNLDETWKPNGNCCEHGWSTSYGSWGETTLWPLELEDILKTARDLPMRTALFQQLRPG